MRIVWRDIFKPRYAIRIRLIDVPHFEPRAPGNFGISRKQVPACTEVPFRRPLSLSYNDFVNRLGSNGSYLVITGSRFALSRLGNIGSVNRHNMNNAVTVSPPPPSYTLVTSPTISHAKLFAKAKQPAKVYDIYDLLPEIDTGVGRYISADTFYRALQKLSSGENVVWVPADAADKLFVGTAELKSRLVHAHHFGTLVNGATEIWTALDEVCTGTSAPSLFCIRSRTPVDSPVTSIMHFDPDILTAVLAKDRKGKK